MTDDMPRRRPPHLQKETTRHGSTVWYVRRGTGPRIRLRDPYGTKAFWQAYEDALKGRAPNSATTKGVAAGTVAWVVDAYTKSREWSEDLSAATRAQRHGLLKAMIDVAGHERLDAINRRSIQEGMDRRKAKPHGANNWLKTMRGLFGWAVDREFIGADPTRGVKLMAGANDRNGFHTWSEEEVAKFERRWDLGTRERLALDILLYTGLRRGDAARLGRQHVRDGKIRIVTEKTQQEVTIRILLPLAKSIAAAPIGDLSFITGERGRPMTKESFGNWFRDACVSAKVPGRAHGLRKAGARRAAENGATEAELNAWFGWADGSRESATYVRGANRAKIAENLANRMAERDAIPAPADPVRGRARKNQRLQMVGKRMAPRAGLEPATRRLTVACSTN
ncbi:integrase [Methylobacterium gnaphalii]|uniref:Integrase n=1 Tax=Methylobacterium gnaphalii TaxID=1010610 RepID=A0A512JF46_9HYPH|nr:integrase [Methylobacterium gnaphalii]GLS50787.1 integrase [Methylobacterium gnaphalii]